MRFYHVKCILQSHKKEQKSQKIALDSGRWCLACLAIAFFRFPVSEFQHLTRSFPLIAPFGLPAAVIPASAHWHGFSISVFFTRHSLLRNEYFPLNIRYLLNDVFSKSDFL
jgi:hypothetical protein